MDFLYKASVNLNLDILRESHHVEEAAWLNRRCEDAQTHETLYYCEVLPDHKIIVHRGPQTGPVVATGLLCRDKEGVTEVHFENEGGVVILEHVKHAPLHVHGKTGFSYGGKSYHWKGHTGLVDDEHGTLLAIFYSSWFDLNWNKVGRLEVTTDGQKMLDVAVITALIVQERSDEERQMRELAAKKGGVPFFI